VVAGLGPGSYASTLATANTGIRMRRTDIPIRPRHADFPNALHTHRSGFRAFAPTDAAR
jgi:hypothetical protein